VSDAEPCRRRELLALALCLLAGALLSAWPHLVSLSTRGELLFVADGDELELYLPVAANAYRDHVLWLEDPVPQPGSRTLYPWLQLGPGIVIARALGLTPVGISFLWRLLAGLAVGGICYALLRQRLRWPWLACALTIFLLGDVGGVFGKPLVRHVLDIVATLLWPRHQIDGWPAFHAQWRLISPALSLPWLLLTALCFLRLQERSSWRRRACAGVTLGLLVPVYFYAWTAAFLGLALWFVLDLVGERKRSKDLLHVGWMALAVGAPAIVAGSVARAEAVAGWLERSDKFVPIGRTEALLFPKIALIFAVLTTLWVWRARRDLLPLVALVLAGLLLLNHQLLTGLQVENWHWQYAYGPILCALIVLLVGGHLERRWPEGAPRSFVVALCLAVGLHLVSALWLRQHELASKESHRATAALRDFLAQDPVLPPGLVAGEAEFVAGAVVLVGRRPVEHASVRFSPVVTEAAWEERIALHAVLRGLDATAFRREQEHRFAHGFFRTWLGTQDQQQERLARRLALFHTTRQALPAVVSRLNVRSVGLPQAQAPPAYLKQGWRRLETSGRWQVWVRD
jgi:hypothetical protein